VRQKIGKGEDKQQDAKTAIVERIAGAPRLMCGPVSLATKSRSNCEVRRPFG
jgi:hypothetical protein